jgi:hypothetical protein
VAGAFLQRPGAAKDRDFILTSKSHPAGRGTLQALLADLPQRLPGRCDRPSGIIAGLLHDLLDLEDRPPQLLAAGIPACALATVDGLAVVMIASIAHRS